MKKLESTILEEKIYITKTLRQYFQNDYMGLMVTENGEVHFFQFCLLYDVAAKLTPHSFRLIWVSEKGLSAEENYRNLLAYARKIDRQLMSCKRSLNA